MGYTLTSKSQVTLPKPIRDHLKVAPGDAVEFRIVADGTVRVEPARPRRAPSDTPSAKALARFRKLRGTAKTGVSTDEWMSLLRGYDEEPAVPGFAPSAAAPEPEGPR